MKKYIWGGGKDTFVVGSVGRMTEEKNQIFLVYVFVELVKLCPNSVLLLVGDGPERTRIRQTAEELHVDDKVYFTGQRTDIAQLLNAIDVFVMPSVYEGFPIAAVEAAANGLPIVLSDTITHELDFLSYARYVSLNDSYTVWAETIHGLRYNDRPNQQPAMLSENSLDIHRAAKLLEGYYLEK